MRFRHVERFIGRAIWTFGAVERRFQPRFMDLSAGPKEVETRSKELLMRLKKVEIGFEGAFGSSY
jgi:hypothetical protein